MKERPLALTAVQHARELDRILLKEQKGEPLTCKELRIKGYGISPCRCQCGVRR